MFRKMLCRWASSSRCFGTRCDVGRVTLDVSEVAVPSSADSSRPRRVNTILLECLTPMNKASRFFETSGTTSLMTLCHAPADCSLQAMLL